LYFYFGFSAKFHQNDGRHGAQMLTFHNVKKIRINDVKKDNILQSGISGLT